MASLAVPYFFPHYLINGTIFEKKKKITEHEKCVLIFSTILAATRLILRRIQRDIQNAHKSSCKVVGCSCHTLWKTDLDRFSKNTQIPDFVRLRPVGAELFNREDGQTDRHDEAESRFSQFCEQKGLLISKCFAKTTIYCTEWAVVDRNYSSIPLPAPH